MTLAVAGAKAPSAASSFVSTFPSTPARIMPPAAVAGRGSGDTEEFSAQERVKTQTFSNLQLLNLTCYNLRKAYLNVVLRMILTNVYSRKALCQRSIITTKKC